MNVLSILMLVAIFPIVLHRIFQALRKILKLRISCSTYIACDACPIQRVIIHVGHTAGHHVKYYGEATTAYGTIDDDDDGIVLNVKNNDVLSSRAYEANDARSTSRFFSYCATTLASRWRYICDSESCKSYVIMLLIVNTIRCDMEVMHTPDILYYSPIGAWTCCSGHSIEHSGTFLLPARDPKSKQFRYCVTSPPPPSPPVPPPYRMVLDRTQTLSSPC